MNDLVKSTARRPARNQASTLERVTFKTSRALDFFSEKELVTQTGHPRDEWAAVLLKELVDNALDACEEADIAPDVQVRADAAGLSVQDNGPGLPEETLRGVLDFGHRVSSREAYVSPDRGAQGNALKTVVPMPFVLDPDQGVCFVIARGVRHRIRCRVDPISQQVQVVDAPEPVEDSGGTRVRIEWAPVYDDHDRPVWPFDFESRTENYEQPVAELLERFVMVNPHLTLRLDWFGKERFWRATDPTWVKWKPNRPTSSHWYGTTQFERLIAAYVTHDRQTGRDRTVAEFVAEFDGLSGTQKRKQVLDLSGLQRSKLSSLVVEDRLDAQRIQVLLKAMQSTTRPVRPERLGLIGEPHFRRRFENLGVVPNSFRYSRKLRLQPDGLPYVLEAAFGWRGDQATDRRLIHAAANWSAAIRNPFRAFGQTGVGLEQALAEMRAGSHEPIVYALHLAHPRLAYTDRGKSALVISD